MKRNWKALAPLPWRGLFSVFIPSSGVTGHLDSLGEECRRALNGSTSQCSRQSPTSSQAPTQELLSEKPNPAAQCSAAPSRLSSGQPTQSVSIEASSQEEEWVDVPIHLKAPESSQRDYHEWTSRDGRPHAKTPQSPTPIQVGVPEATPSEASWLEAASTQLRMAILEG